VNNQQVTSVAETAELVQYESIVGVHIDDQRELAGSSLALTLWTGGKTGILVRVQEEVVTWALLPMLSSGACHGMPNLLNDGVGGDFTLIILLIKSERLFDLFLLR
jgi:hypothetical protein